MGRKSYWIKNRLIEAESYADALRCGDLLADGMSMKEAEAESGAHIVRIPGEHK